MKNRAIFLDRDGTVSDEVGYLNHVSRLRVFPWSGPSIRAINESPFLAVLVTNQAGGALGEVEADDRADIVARVVGGTGGRGLAASAAVDAAAHGGGKARRAGRSATGRVHG